MIISDLNHFEFVAETNSIVGGSAQPLSLQLASTTLQDLSSQLSSPLKVGSLITTGGQDTSATAGSFTTKIAGEQLKGVISTAATISK